MFDDNLKYDITLTNRSFFRYREPLSNVVVNAGQSVTFEVVGTERALRTKSNVAQFNSLNKDVIDFSIQPVGDGSTSEPDLTDYYTKSETDNLISSAIPNIPTDVSAFVNDAGYLTQHQDISGKQDNLNAPDNANKILNGELQWVDMPSGGGGSGSGGMSMTVIDYDPTLPANQTVTTIGIDQAFPVAGTCTISGNTVTVATPVNSGAVYVGLPLSTDAEFEFDINIVNHGVYFLKSTDDFNAVLSNPNNVAYHVVLKANSYSITQVAMKGDGTAPTYPRSNVELPINPTLKFMTGEAMMFLETGLSTMQEVRDMLAGMGMSEQDVNDTIAAYTSMNWLVYQASSKMEAFQIPKEFNMIYFVAGGQNTGDTFTIGVTKNNKTTYSVPSGLVDGTYLKALGNCTLLGKSMKTGDFLQLYNSSQDGILIRQ